MAQVEGNSRTEASATQSYGMRFSVTGADLVLALGLGGLVAWTMMLFSSANAYYMYNADGIVALERAYFPFAISAVAGYFAFGTAYDHLQDLLEGKWGPLASAGVMTASTLGTVLLNDTAPAMAISGVLAGLSSSALFTSYATRFYHLSAREGLVLSIAAYGCAIALFALYAYMPLSTSLPFAVTVCLASGVCLAAFDAHAAEPIHHSANVMQLEVRPRLALGFAVLVGIWAGIGEFVRSSAVHIPLSAMDNILFSHAQAIALLLIMTIVIVSMAGLIALPKAFRLSLPYRVVLLVTLVAIALLPLAADPGMLVAIYSLASSATLLVSMVAWALSLAVARTTTDPPVKTIGRIRAVWMLGTVLGFGISLAVYPVLADSSRAIVLASVTLVAVLVLSYLSLFTEHDADELSRLYPSQRRERFRNTCQQVGRRHDLSERETEVMMHLAMGHNAERIAQDLYISYNTVTTHRKHIYQKLDVHSQQELIELLDKAKS